MSSGSLQRRHVLGFALPLVLALIILLADRLEGPKTAYVGVLTAMPFIAAVFLGPWGTFGVGVLTWLLGAVFGAYVASDGNVEAQLVRLLFIALAIVGATFAASLRVRLEHRGIQARDAQVLAGLAVRDPLTELTSRLGAERWLESLPPADRCVLVCDADQLKQVNDTLGHDQGDAYLSAMAGRLRSVVAAGDLVARWGGDEFLVVLDASIEDATRAAERIVETVHGDPVALGDARISPSLCIGVASWPAGTEFAAAFRRADTAMYEAKAQGSGRVAAFAG